MNETIAIVYSKYILYFATAIFGGIAHALMIQRKGGLKGFWDGVGLATISGFAATMWLMIALNFFPEKIFLVAFASGFGGYMSVEGLAVLAAKMKEIISRQ